MTPAITFDDYTRIGTMETALSEHADEVFFELSAEKQKIAEKIFKCLTETDRENRETRRATTIEKLCAVAAADFADVASIIDAFRPEGRTFLMPPPEVELNKNTLIDISHESLIRKWERLKKWVEEEGQSSRTYRRLAEDALLHKQGKVGFWSEPELSDALEWRADFEPNETWAQLYKEKGERQYRASFAESMQYLDDSKAFRDAEIAEDERQQNALRKYAKNLRWAVIGLIFVLLGTVGVAAFAYYQMNEAVRIKDALSDEKKYTEALNLDLEEKSVSLKNAVLNLESSEAELKDSLDLAELEKERADEQAEQAKLSETEKQKALEQQKRLRAEAEAAKAKAEEKQIEAQNSLREAVDASKRDKINRDALVFLEQGEFEKALALFDKLYEYYSDESEFMNDEARMDGMWWCSHNAGIVYSKLNNFEEAEKSYKGALYVLGEPDEPEIGRVNYSRQFFQPVSYKADTAVNRSKIATLRRLAQLYRSQVETSTVSEEWQKFTFMAKHRYERLIELMKEENFGETQMADVYVELADTLGDAYDRDSYDSANEYYIEAADIYERTRNFVKEVAALKKLAELDLYQQAAPAAGDVLLSALEIQEDKEKMNLPPVNLEVADTYDRLAKAKESAGGDGADVESSNYAEVSRLIGDLNFKTNIKKDFEATDVSALANAYVKIGKCRRAEKVYSYAFLNFGGNGEYMHGQFVDLYVFNEMADFYQNVMRDERNAQVYFDRFVTENEGSQLYTYLETAASIDFINENFYERAGDFYLARKNYAQAEKLYEDASKIIETKLKKDSWKYSPTSLKLTAAKAGLLVKKALLFEAQNKLLEAETKFSEALETAPQGVRDAEVRFRFMLIRARVSIDQAEFYERHGVDKKALEIYTDLKNALINRDGYGISEKQVAAYIDEIHILSAIVYKKFGDHTRQDAATAERSYFDALTTLERFEESAAKDKYPQYFKNNAPSAKFYNELAEAYEASISLTGIKIEDWKKERAIAVRKKANELKLEEQKSPCEKED